LSFCGCGNDKDEEASSAKSFVVEKNSVKFTVIVSSDTISVADILEISFKVEAPEESGVILPEGSGAAGEFTIISASAETRSVVGEKKVSIQQHLELAPFLAGDTKIPPFELKVEGREKFALKSPEIPIKVLSAFVGSDIPKELKGIAPPRDYPESYLLLCVAGLIIFVAVIIFLVWYFKFRKGADTILIKTPYEIATEQLSLLREKGLIDKGLIKEFYSEVSDILRWYIEGRFALRAPELTTEEFMNELQNSDALTLEYKNLLKEFLQHCDMVKFAALAPAGTDIVNTITSCERFVEETRPVVLEEEDGGGNAV